MTPHPSYYYGYSDQWDHCYSRYPTSTSRRGFTHCFRRNDVRHYGPSRTHCPMSSSPTTFPHSKDSLLCDGQHPRDRTATDFASVTSTARRSRVSSSSSSSCSTPQLPSPPKHPQLIKTMLCDFWRRGEVCRYEPNCWFAHGPAQLRTANDNLPMFNEVSALSNALNAGQFTVESLNQLTPEQQQWMILSQHGHGYPPPSQGDLQTAVRTCEELEREQTLYCQLRTMGRTVQVSPSTSGVDSLPSSGPPSPSFSGGFFSSAIEESIRDQALSTLSAMVSRGLSSTIQDYYVNLAKEECPLYHYGCCPFKEDCFFEHTDMMKK
uniref:C3H1-type domain-containing protein n=1 Tax=Haemonchus contortus TaxID=6289 RepID=A0A7I5EEV1_HAECO